MNGRLKKYLYSSIIIFILLGIFAYLQIGNKQSIDNEIFINNDISLNTNINEGLNKNLNNRIIDSNYQSPLSEPNERITKKPFGIKITKSDSPILPERFSGYHTGADFEVFTDELNIDVEVKSFCSGELRMKTTAGGYGGVIVQECELENQSVTVLYGHIKITSVKFDIGSNINKGDIIGLLGADKSTETDGERKHLHFGIHTGDEINIKGYVQTKEELDNWLDPMQYI